MSAVQVAVSPRVAAALLLRLARPLSPVARAAKRHERSLQLLMTRAFHAARDAVSVRELTEALQYPGTGAASFAVGPAVDRITDVLLGTDESIRFAAPGQTLPNVLSSTLASGAGASALCVIDVPVISGDYVKFKSSVGEVEAKLQGNVLQVQEAFVSEAARGRKEGVALYKRLFHYADDQGLELQSSHAVSVSADRVWNSLKNQGYNVRRADLVELDTALDKFYAVKEVTFGPGQSLLVRTGEPLWQTIGAAKVP